MRTSDIEQKMPIMMPPEDLASMKNKKVKNTKHGECLLLKKGEAAILKDFRQRRKLLAKLFPNLFMIVFHNTAEDINHVRLVTYANADLLLIGKTK